MATDVIDVVKIKNGANQRVADAEDIRGAFATVPDVAARDAIQTAILRTGAIARISNTTAFYEWTGSAWIAFNGFGGSTGSGDWKDSVKAATTTALAASTRVSNTRTANANGAFPTIDGVNSWSVDDRILDKDNATGADRGIWAIVSPGSVSTPWVLARTGDADTSAEFTGGLRVPVVSGTLNGGKVFKLDTADPITLNTTSLSFSQDSGGAVTAGNGLTGTSTLSVLPDGSSLSVSGSGVKVATGGVTATEIATNAVTTTKIPDGNVTDAKLATAYIKDDGSRPLTAAWDLGNQSLTNAKSLAYHLNSDGNLGATPTIDWSAGAYHEGTCNANCTPTFVAPPARTAVRLKVIGDGTQRTFTQPGSVVVVGVAPTIASGSGAVTFLDYWYDGTNYYLWGEIQSQLGPRGGENVQLDLFPSTQQQQAIGPATSTTRTWDVAVPTGKRLDIVASVWIDNGSGGACDYFKKLNIIAHQTSGAAVIVDQIVISAPNEGGNYSFVATVSTTNIRFTLTNTSGTDKAANIAIGDWRMDKP